jgi:hypothetical protein
MSSIIPRGPHLFLVGELTSRPARNWREVVNALSQRQQHPVSRRTVLALLYKGGFLQRDKRWFAAPDSATGQRSLRNALALLPQVEAAEHPQGTNEYVRARVQAIKQRLEEIGHLV